MTPHQDPEKPRQELLKKLPVFCQWKSTGLLRTIKVLIPPQAAYSNLQGSALLSLESQHSEKSYLSKVLQLQGRDWETGGGRNERQLYENVATNSHRSLR